MFDELKAKLDLTKKNPGYYRVWIFRTSVALMLILTGVVVGHEELYDNRQRVFFRCPADALVPCENPFQHCLNAVLPDNPQWCDTLEKAGCYGDLCGSPLLQPGEFVGRRPSLLYVFYRPIFAFLFIGAFGLNHLLYKKLGKVRNHGH